VFSADSSLLAFVGYGYYTEVWDVAHGEFISQLEVSNSGYRLYHEESDYAGMAFTPDGSALVIGGNDDRTRINDVRTGGEIIVLQEGPVVALSSDGTILATGSRVKTVRLWHVPAGSF
jgi:WD40 repeat protein